MPETTMPLDITATVDRRSDVRRTPAERRSAVPGAPHSSSERRGTGGGSPRRKGERRRQIDPTTCERDYNDDEIEFMKAMDEYKRKSGRMFPTWSEVLEVMRGLGYRKVEAKIEMKNWSGSTADGHLARVD